jgi:flagellar biosynthesis/type III secretory pathway protein FliH
MTEEIDWEMYEKILQECKELGQFKNKQYGTASLKLFDGMAIVTRINDKVARLNHLMTSYQNPEQGLDETIDDTLKDLINYATYLIILRKGGIS